MIFRNCLASATFALVGVCSHADGATLSDATVRAITSAWRNELTLSQDITAANGPVRESAAITGQIAPAQCLSELAQTDLSISDSLYTIGAMGLVSLTLKHGDDIENSNQVFVVAGRRMTDQITIDRNTITQIMGVCSGNALVASYGQKSLDEASAASSAASDALEQAAK